MTRARKVPSSADSNLAARSSPGGGQSSPAAGALSLDELPLSMKDTARAINRSYEWFSRHWQTLVDEDGFPPPFTTRPYGWDRTHIRAWKDRNLPEALAGAVGALRGTPPPKPANENTIEAQRLEIHKKLGLTG